MEGEVSAPCNSASIKVARYILEYIKALPEQERPKSDSMKWTVGVDPYEIDDPHAVVIPAERTAEVASKIRAMEQ